jgi:cytokinin trans-hydroxylase
MFEQLGMILNEAHRHFTSILQISRVAKKDMQLGDNFVPKGLSIEIPLLHIHHDPRLWGEDALQFNPNRFANGVSKACQHPQAFIPLSFGPCYCIGQHFGMMESKIVVASMLLRFQLSISPNYKHCPLLFWGLFQVPRLVCN